MKTVVSDQWPVISESRGHRQAEHCPLPTKASWQLRQFLVTTGCDFTTGEFSFAGP